MCGLCAALNAGRAWTDAAGRPQFSRAGSPIRASDERDRLVRLANGVLQHYGLTVSDWGGGSYMVANPAGQNENVYALAGIWESVDALLNGQTADPLDEALIESLEGLVSARRTDA